MAYDDWREPVGLLEAGNWPATGTGGPRRSPGFAAWSSVPEKVAVALEDLELSI